MDKATVDAARSLPQQVQVFKGRVPFCWIAPNGEYYPVFYGGHAASALGIFANAYHEEALQLEPDSDDDLDALLESRGWMKLQGFVEVGYCFSRAQPGNGHRALKLAAARPSEEQVKTAQLLIAQLKGLGESGTARDLEQSLELLVLGEE